MRNTNDIIGNQTHDLPACSEVPQPTAPPRAPTYVSNLVCNQSFPSDISPSTEMEFFHCYFELFPLIS